MKKLLPILLAAMIVCVGGCGIFKTDSECYYKVTTSDNREVSVTYESAEGTSQRDVSTPWTSEKFDVEDEGFVYISAQRQDTYVSGVTTSGDVTVYIYKDGDSWKNNSSSGSFVIASASGSF